MNQDHPLPIHRAPCDHLRGDECGLIGGGCPDGCQLYRHTEAGQ